MKFVIDQQLPPALIAWVQKRGHEAEHVRNIGLRDAVDPEIWRHAEQSGSAVITKDENFASRRSRVAAGPVIIWLRIGNSTTPELFEWLDAKWPSIEVELSGQATVIEVR